MRIVAIVLRHRLRDAPAILPENRAAGVGVLARAVACDPFVAILTQDFRMGAGQPAWRRRRWRAHDGADAMTAEHRDCTVKQVEIEHVFLRLENVPGEFAEADNIE